MYLCVRRVKRAAEKCENGSRKNVACPSKTEYFRTDLHLQIAYALLPGYVPPLSISLSEFFHHEFIINMLTTSIQLNSIL